PHYSASCRLCSPLRCATSARSNISTLSLHDALPIWPRPLRGSRRPSPPRCRCRDAAFRGRRSIGSAARSRSAPPDRDLAALPIRSEEHTSELQSRGHLVCRLLLEKKKKNRDAYKMTR